MIQAQHLPGLLGVLVLCSASLQGQQAEAANSPVPVSNSTLQDPSEAGSPWSFYGDFRLRWESNDNQGSEDRHRQRIRLRAGAGYQVSEELSLGARLTTGNRQDPNNPHVDLGHDGFDRWEFNLDRAFLHYEPHWWESLWMDFGKFSNPIRRNPVFGELIYDADVQPEGVVAGIQQEHWQLVIGEYVITEQSLGEESLSTVLQASGQWQDWNASLGYFFYGDVTPDRNQSLIRNDNAGNALTPSGRDFASRFGILHGLLSYSWDSWVFAGEYFQNLRAASGIGDQGFALGSAYQAGDSKFYYQYQSIEQDAVFSAFAQDDFPTGMQTNYQGHVLGWKYKISEPVQLHVWLMAAEPEDAAAAGLPAETFYRFRIDLNLSF
ncbi:MAG: hypothetical protein DWQ01_11475 [Planctomycetota bacterium]|nr:MAG: hypothetical protein DWQ01_11475 [Planctomycetota bacterium]